MEKSFATARRGHFRNFDFGKIVRNLEERNVVSVSSENLEHPEYSCPDRRLSSRRVVTRFVRGLFRKHLRKLRDLKFKLMLLCDYKKDKEMQEFNFKMPNSVITEILSQSDPEVGDGDRRDSGQGIGIDSR